MKEFKIINVITLLLFVSIIVFATKGPANITVTYNNIKLVIDGVTITPSVEPFILKDGKIAVSAEDIARAFGKEIKYDAKTSTLYIGRQPSGSWCYLSDKQPLQWKGEYILNPGEIGKPFSIVGKDYIKGIKLGCSKYDDFSEIEFNLSGEFKKLSCLVGISDEHRGKSFTSDLIIYYDGQIAYEYKGIKPGDFPRNIDLDVTNVIKIKFRFIQNESSSLIWLNIVNPILTR